MANRIVRSRIISTIPQSDGRSYVRERHTFESGEIFERESLVDAGVDLNARMLAIVPLLEAQKDKEDAERLRNIEIESVNRKLFTFVKDLTDLELQTDVGLTAEEIARLRAEL